MQNALVKIKVLLKLGNGVELALLLGMGTQGSVMGHVQDTHPLKAQEFPVQGVSQFPVQHGPKSAGLANKVGPGLDSWKRQATPILGNRREDQPKYNPCGMPSSRDTPEIHSKKGIQHQKKNIE
jgi:hypothetical protein